MILKNQLKTCYFFEENFEFYFVGKKNDIKLYSFASLFIRLLGYYRINRIVFGSTYIKYNNK